MRPSRFSTTRAHHPVRFAALCLALAIGFRAEAQAGMDAPPEQVSVSVKIVEWQFSKTVETGLSAFLQRQALGMPFGSVSDGINTADLTFPTSVGGGISVFLDRIRLGEGALELVLQALEDENRAFILSRPKVLVQIGNEAATKIETTQEIPYEDTIVVGASVVQVTRFRPTGVILEVTAQEIIDDDGDWSNNQDTYIKLKVVAQVTEEGQRVVVSLDDDIASSGIFTQSQNEISVPELISRNIDTTVWVRHGQVLMLGGLFRNTDSKTVSTLPWLTQAEDAAIGLLERATAGNIVNSPISNVLGNRTKTESHRELVFLIKSEVWRSSFTVMGDFDLTEDEEEPKSGIGGVLQGITEFPREIGGRITGGQRNEPETETEKEPNQSTVAPEKPPEDDEP